MSDTEIMTILYRSDERSKTDDDDVITVNLRREVGSQTFLRLDKR